MTIVNSLYRRMICLSRSNRFVTMKTLIGTLSYVWSTYIRRIFYRCPSYWDLPDHLSSHSGLFVSGPSPQKGRYAWYLWPSASSLISGFPWNPSPGDTSTLPVRRSHLLRFLVQTIASGPSQDHFPVRILLFRVNVPASSTLSYLECTSGINVRWNKIRPLVLPETLSVPDDQVVVPGYTSLAALQVHHWWPSRLWGLAD